MRIKAIIAVIIAGTMLTGCGSSSSSSSKNKNSSSTNKSSKTGNSTKRPTPSPSPTKQQDELRDAVQAYSDAYLTGDAARAYGYLSERCRKRMPLTEFTRLVTAAKELYGTALPFETYTSTVTADSARVTYTYSVKAINQDREPWVREKANWHSDDC